MKKSELRQMIKEELLSEGNNTPLDYRITKDGKNLILIFEDEQSTTNAIQSFAKFTPRRTQDNKGLMIPVISVVRRMVNDYQNKAWNPRN